MFISPALTFKADFKGQNKILVIGNNIRSKPLVNNNLYGDIPALVA